MARPERNNVDYFPFLCDEGTKMYYIEETYGNDGFSTFIKLLRELAKAEYHYLDLSKKTTLMFLSAKCKVSIDVLKAIITDLAELGKFDEDLWGNESIIWCQDFVDSIEDAYKKRNNDCITRNSLVDLLIVKGRLKPRKRKPKPSKGESEGDGKPQSKEEERKEKENKLFNGVLEYYHGVCINLPKVVKLNASRKKAIESRIKDYDKETLKKVLDLVAESDYLNGNSERGWKANFDWIFKPANFIKILEENYKNNGNTKENRPKIDRAEFEHSIEQHFPKD